jgi:EAL domain-containing protein (putative c-di-GMP-specific phosphodiesterase class I)
MLHEKGCMLGQGYLYSHPLEVPEFEERYLIQKLMAGRDK